MEGGHVVLDDGDEFDSETIVWTAGVRPHPMLEATDLPLDDKNRLDCTPFLQVKGTPGAWAAGDCAGVPDLSKGGDATTGPSAQHAVRQAKRLALNLLAELRGRAARGLRARLRRLGGFARACTRASPRSTASGFAGSPRGSCTAPTT